MLIIGITGTLGAGKGTVVEYLKEKGFTHYSASGFITEEIRRRGLPINRDTMHEVANDLRAQHSPSFIVEELYVRAVVAGKDVMIEALHTVGEVRALKARGNFYLLAIDADPKIRYARIVERKSEKDLVSFEKFLADEQAHINTDDPTKQNLPACAELADAHFSNDGTVAELRAQVDRALEAIVGK